MYPRPQTETSPCDESPEFSQKIRTERSEAPESQNFSKILAPRGRALRARGQRLAGYTSNSSGRIMRKNSVTLSSFSASCDTGSST